MIIKQLFNIFKKFDKRLFIVSIILFALGLLMIYSSSNVTAIMFGAAPGRYFYKEFIFVISGFFLTCFFILFNTKTYYKVFTCLLIIVGFIMLSLFVYGSAVNGAYNWIGYGGFGIQPSEFAKIFVIPFLAFYYEKKQKYKNDWKKMLFPIGLCVILCFFIILENDYGTAFIFSLIVSFMFFLSPTDKKIKGKVGLIGIGCILLFIIAILAFGNKFIDADKLDRFNFSNPCDRYLTTGNQLCNGYIAINGGGLFGKGLGNSTQKYLYLPEGHTDFIFAIFVEELGLVGAIGLFILYIFLLFRIYIDGKKCNSTAFKLICYGICIYLFLHITINLGGVLGLIPLTGVPLVFMSYGGSICWCLMLALGMVQRINFEDSRLS